MFDHTDAASVYNKSQLLNGAPNYQVGLAKSFDVMAGDVFDLEVWAKYESTTGSGTNLSGLFTALTTVFNLPPTGGTGLESSQARSAFGGLYDQNVFIGDETGYEDPAAPKAYLNYVLFDDQFTLLDFGFDQVDAGADQNGVHDQLSLHVKVQKKGYLYVFISNENPVMQNVYFDDLKIVRHTYVETVSDYYPFGLQFNTYQRGSSVKNKFKFQGQEHVDDLGLNWDSFKWRNHQPDIGRFFNIDPLADKYVYNSPYAFSENHVVAHRELEGLEKISVNVSLFEPKETDFQSPGQAIEHPSKPRNTTFGDVINKENLVFNVDLQTGENKVQRAHDWDKGFIDSTIDLMKGEVTKLNYTLDIKVKGGNFSFSGTIDGTAFTITGNVTKDKINTTSQIRNAPQGDGAVITIGSADQGGAPDNIIAIKQGGTDAEQKQNASQNYIIRDIPAENTTYIESNDTNRKTSTVKKN